MKQFILALSILLCLIGKQVQAQTAQSHWPDDYSVDNAIESNSSQLFSQAQLAQMLAPIALYPDSLLTHILIASTYPLELVQAQRWLDRNSAILSDDIYAEIDDKDWDESVKALVPFPQVLKRLNDDLFWTQQLGDAFLSDETRVLASVQQLRQKAEQAGTLAKMSNSTVRFEADDIVIESVQPQVVYVPYYDTRIVYGTWHWRHYPPVYWSTPRHFYSSSYYDPYYQPFYWHSGVHISFNYFFGAFHWQNRQVVVVHHHNKRFYGRTHHYRSRQQIVRSSGAKRWHHKPQHRRGVAYSNNKLKKRFHSNREAVVQSKHNRRFAKSYHREKETQSNSDKRNNHKNKNKSYQSRSHKTNKSQQLSRKHNLTKNKLAKQGHTKYGHRPKGNAQARLKPKSSSTANINKQTSMKKQHTRRDKQKKATTKQRYNTIIAKTSQHSRNRPSKSDNNRSRGKSQQRRRDN